jgi:hypothetical protein
MMVFVLNGDAAAAQPARSNHGRKSEANREPFRRLIPPGKTQAVKRVWLEPAGLRPAKLLERLAADLIALRALKSLNLPTEGSPWGCGKNSRATHGCPAFCNPCNGWHNALDAIGSKRGGWGLFILVPPAR